MAKDFESLKQQALVIKNEVEDGANNTERVGGMLEDIVESMKLGTTEFNVSAFFPTGGTNGSNKYDLASAIGKVPAELRTAGLKVSFLNSSGKPESWKYQGGSWAVANFIKEADGGNKILTWVTDAATTRKQVAVNERKGGMQISYKPNGEDWVNEQYIGTSFTDTEWVKDSNWTKMASENDVVKVKDVTNGLSYNTCKSDIEAAQLIQGENRKLNMEITYDKYVEGKFSVLVIGTTGYSTGESGNFYVTIDGTDYTIPYSSPNFATFKSMRGTITDYFSSHPLDGWTIVEEGDGLRFTKDEGVDETFSFSAGKPLIEEFELSFTEEGKKYLSKDSFSFSLYTGSYLYSCAANCWLPKNTTIKDILSIFKSNTKPTAGDYVGYIKTEILSENSFRASFDNKYQGIALALGSTIKDGTSQFDFKYPSELTVTRRSISSYINDKFGIYIDKTYPDGEFSRTIQYIGTDLTDSKWLNILNWKFVDKSPMKSELDKCSLWNKKDETLTIDISDGKPLFVSLSVFSSARGIFEAEYFDINGQSIYSFLSNHYQKYANTNVISNARTFLPKSCMVRNDGWSILYGYNFGAAKVVIKFFKNVANSPYFDDLYILKEDDFNRILGIDEEFKINIATRDMATFAGGFNNMLDKIFEKKPWQKCLFLTPILRQGVMHWAYPNALPNTKCSSQVVELLAKYWNQPCIDLSNLGLWVHKGANNMKTIMPDALHTATSSPDVRIYVTLDGTAGESGTLDVSANDFCNAVTIDIAEGDNSDSILQKIYDNIVVGAHMVKSLDTETKSVLIHFDTVSYDPNSYGNQKNNIPQITSTLDNVVITVKQPDNQCRVVAKFLAAQLTSIFGNLNGQRILWIGTSIPNGNTNGWASGEKYPELIQEITGCVMENVSHQGTCIRKYDPEFVGDNDDGKPVLTNSWNYNTSEGNSAFLSLEGILKKINTIDSPDIIVFDHGINDEFNSIEWTVYTWDNIYRED